MRSGPAVVEDRMELAEDIRTAVAVVGGNSPAVVVEVEADHRMVDSGRLAEEPGYKAG